MKILFIGATGMLGKPVANELIKQGFDLTILARNPEKAKSLFPDALITKGDVFDKTSIAAAMQGIDAVYCNLSVAQTSKEKEPQPEREGIENILASAKVAGIRRIGYISSLVHRYQGMNGFNWWAFKLKNSAIEKIKASGTPYTIFYPSFFMESYPYLMIRKNKIAILGTSVSPMWLIAGQDYAKQVARSFQFLTTENREYAVQGTEAFTFPQANKIVIENYPKGKLGILKAPIGLFKFFSLFSQKFDYGWRICEALNKYPEKFESEQTWKELSKPQISLAEYIRGL